MGIRDLVTVLEGKDWVIRTSQRQNIIVQNYHELQELQEKYKDATKVPKYMGNYFMYKHSDAYKRYVEQSLLEAIDVWNRSIQIALFVCLTSMFIYILCI